MRRTIQPIRMKSRAKPSEGRSAPKRKQRSGGVIESTGNRSGSNQNQRTGNISARLNLLNIRSGRRILRFRRHPEECSRKVHRRPHIHSPSPPHHHLRRQHFPPPLSPPPSPILTHPTLRLLTPPPLPTPTPPQNFLHRLQRRQQ